MGKKKQYDADAWGRQRERSFWGVLIAALVVGLALWLEVAVHPPFWVHVILWVPITTFAVP